MFSKKADCPLWRAPCKEHQCRWFINVIGQNPNTGEQINKWGCSMELLPMLVIENAQQTRQAGASIDSFRNEMVRANGVLGAQLALHDDRLRLTSE